MSMLPTGTVTFLFTDVEGSTRLWEQAPGAMGPAMVRHDQLIERAVQGNGGSLVRPRGEGDSRFAVFERAPGALAAARDIQEALAGAEMELPAPLRVRIAIHTGQADLRAGDYYGTAVNRCARLRALASGGQTLVSQATFELARDEVPERTVLTDLGEHRLRDLERAEHVYQLAIAGLAADFPPLHSVDLVPNNLPIQLTSFVGREQELSQVKQQLRATRLLTLTGSGGTGKTRLSLQVAAEMTELFPDGVWFVDLAPLSDPALVPQTVALVLGVREQSGRALTATLSDYMAHKTQLLILDNCEHLIDACAQLANNLLHACPRIRILATSREALGIAGEVTWPVPSLDIPAVEGATVESLSQSAAVRLLLERAAAVRPNFTLTAANAPAVAQVCTRLDGIPLALELAASRLRGLTVEQLAARLDDRFRLLTGGSRTALPRQQTLRALIDWSYALLSEPERVLFRRLAVFQGGWTLDAAQAVCGETQPDDVLDLLLRLMDKSLAVAVEQEGVMRYRLLETIRQYAREKLIESDEIERLRDAHLAFFADWTSQAGAMIRAGQRTLAFKLLDADYDNLRAALTWALDRDTERALQLVGDLPQYWGSRGLATEGRNWITQALERDSEESARSPEIRARRRTGRAGALAGLAMVMVLQGQDPLAEGFLQEAVDLYRETGDQVGLADSLPILSMVRMRTGGSAAALDMANQAIAIAESAKAWPALALAFAVRGTIYLEVQGDVVQAQLDFEKSTALARHAGYNWGSVLALILLANLRVRQGDSTSARALFARSMDISLEEGNKQFRNMARSGLAEIARREGDNATAIEQYRETLKGWQELGNMGAVSRCFECLAFIAIAEADKLEAPRQGGYLERAAQLFGAAAALREATRSPMTPIEAQEFEKESTVLRERLGPDMLKTMMAKGQALTREQAIQLALTA